jgi:nucleotide-binding universal stress UspA family protein
LILSSITKPDKDKRYRFLVCLDGSDESYRGLRYAARLGKGVDADIVLLYIRSIDLSLRYDRLRDSPKGYGLLAWGDEVPGVRYLEKGRNLLVELGVMSLDWSETIEHVPVADDPVGDNKVVYRSEEGKMVVLKLKVASDIATGILDQIKLADYDLVIVGAADTWRDSDAVGFWDSSMIDRVAKEAPCSVLVARDLEVGHGHLICTNGSDKSTDVVRADAVLATRCQCPVSLISVATDESKEVEAKRHVEDAKAMLSGLGIEVQDTLTPVGDPVKEIVEAGPDYSLIVLSDSAASGLQRFFKGSVTLKVLKEAYNSVMIVR